MYTAVFTVRKPAHKLHATYIFASSHSTRMNGDFPSIELTIVVSGNAIETRMFSIDHDEMAIS